MKQVQIKNRMLLGDNIKKYVRKQSNPQQIRTMHKYYLGGGCQINSQIGLAPFTPVNQETNDDFKKNNEPQYIKNKFNFSSRLKMMLDKQNKTISSRLFAQDQRGISLASPDTKSKGSMTQTTFARTTKFNKFSNKESTKQIKTRKKIKQLFSTKPQIQPQQLHHLTPIKHSTKTSNFFSNTQRKPWHTVRVNNQVVIFDTNEHQKPKKSKSNYNQLSFYNTIYK